MNMMMLMQKFCFAHFACLPYLAHLVQSISLLGKSDINSGSPGVEMHYITLLKLR